MPSRRAYLALVVAATVLAGCTGLDLVGPSGDPVPVETLEAGNRSEIRERRTVAVTDAAAWADLWAEHTGESNATRPSVDLANRTLLAAFRGESPDCSGVDFTSVHRLEGGSLRVEGQWWTAEGGYCTERITFPYRFATIPVPDADVAFHMDETTR